MLTQDGIILPFRQIDARIALSLSGGFIQLVHHPHLQAVALHDDVNR